MSSAQENKAIFRRYVEEVSNQGNLQLEDEIFDRYLAHQPDGSVLERGPEDVKRFEAEFHNAFPDYHVTIEDQIAEHDKVVTRWRMRITHLGEFRGVAPTGKDVEINGIGIFRFSEEGKVVESWDSYDQLSLSEAPEYRARAQGSPKHTAGFASQGGALPTADCDDIDPYARQCYALHCGHALLRLLSGRDAGEYRCSALC